MKPWNSDVKIQKKEMLSNLAEKCAESIAKATESVAALESALEKVKKQKVNFGFMERFDVDENWEVMKALEAQIKLKEYIKRINQPEYNDIVWKKDEVVLLLQELVAK